MDHDQLPGKYYPKCNESIPPNDDYGELQNEEIFRRIYQYEPETRPKITERIKEKMKCNKDTFYNVLPIMRWLPKYKKEYVFHDVIAGLTVAVMHIPQGMAYASLGGVPPVVGMYMAVFPVLIYILMGTSHHVSMGTFAVVCMMTGKVVDIYVYGHEETSYEMVFNSTTTFDISLNPSPLEVATAVCFVTGAWQIVFGVLKLGSLSVFLSESLISGFTTGASIHVFASQMKSFFGLKIKRHAGPLKIIYTFYDICTGLRDANYVAVMISTCTIAFLIAYNEWVKPLMKKKLNRVVPIPIELIMISTGTVLSMQFDLRHAYNVDVIDNVPTGLPVPSGPPLDLLPKLLLDGLTIGIVAVSVNISLASIFAKKLNYRIDSNQEILASGAGNLFSSFFSCMPYAASLSRSLIQESTGGITQLTSVVSCGLLIVVLLFIAPFFESLPYCVLSAIIIVSLKGMFLQFKDFPRILKLSKLDAFVWMATFLSVTVLDIDYGLGIGLAASFGTMILHGQTAEVSVLGCIPGTQIYRDRRRYRRAQTVRKILPLKIIGGLNFANVNSVREKILKEIDSFCMVERSIAGVAEKFSPPFSVVLNMSSVSYMDPSSVKCLKSVCSDITDAKICCVLCEFVPSVYDTLRNCNFFSDFTHPAAFPTMSNAISYLEISRAQDLPDRTTYRLP